MGDGRMTVPLVIDTREKKPYRFPGVDSVIYKKLNVGDYTFQGFEDVFAVERKSLDDLANSVGTDRDRFEAEIERAQELTKFAVVIEADRRQVEKDAGTKHSTEYYSNIYPNSVLGTVDKWPDKYDTLEFSWAGDRQASQQQTLYYLDKWYLEYR